MSKSLAACVGAVGMNARKRGFSTEVVAVASSARKSSRAASPPSPSAVIVSPTAAAQLGR